MGDLFFNKIAAVIIALVLGVLLIREMSHMLIHPHEEGLAYPVDLSVLGVTGGEEEQEEAGPVDYGLLMASASVSAGERVFSRCQTCHNYEQGGGNGAGPNLWNIVGKTIGATDGFNYSGALPQGEWGYEELDGFFTRPSAWAPGTSMGFVGLRNQEDRINLIAFLREQSDAPYPLPAPLAAEESAADE